jgi:hypothetical protein
MVASRLAARLPIPIATSALMQIPSIMSTLPPTKAVAILTYDAARLGPLHLQQLGVNIEATDRFLIRGVPEEGHLQSMIAGRVPYSYVDIEAELVQLATDTVKERGHVGAIVLECTQMPPFAEAVQHAVGPSVPVYDVYTLGCWFYSGLARRRPAAWGKEI